MMSLNPAWSFTEEHGEEGIWQFSPCSERAAIDIVAYYKISQEKWDALLDALEYHFGIAEDFD
jgi:hypothetical protein